MRVPVLQASPHRRPCSCRCGVVCAVCDVDSRLYRRRSADAVCLLLWIRQAVDRRPERHPPGACSATGDAEDVLLMHVQIYVNFRRSSTRGWNMWNVYLDLLGGTCTNGGVCICMCVHKHGVLALVVRVACMLPVACMCEVVSGSHEWRRICTHARVCGNMSAVWRVRVCARDWVKLCVFALLADASLTGLFCLCQIGTDSIQLHSLHVFVNNTVRIRLDIVPFWFRPYSHVCLKVKLGLSIFSIMFNMVFMAQHYLCFRTEALKVRDSVLCSVYLFVQVLVRLTASPKRKKKNF